MKVGDLVVLSSGGKERNGNYKCRSLGGFGIIKEISNSFQISFPIRVTWWSADMNTFFHHNFKRYEIKKFNKQFDKPQIP